jgi:hypothetical protein
MEEDFDNIQKSFRDKKTNMSGRDSSRDKSSNIKGLIKSVFSTSSLSSSLNKLATIGRSTSNTSRMMSGFETSKSGSSLSKNNSLVMSHSSKNLPQRPLSSYISIKESSRVQIP